MRLAILRAGRHGPSGECYHAAIVLWRSLGDQRTKAGQASESPYSLAAQMCSSITCWQGLPALYVWVRGRL